MLWTSWKQSVSGRANVADCSMRCRLRQARVQEHRVVVKAESGCTPPVQARATMLARASARSEWKRGVDRMRRSPCTLSAWTMSGMKQLALARKTFVEL
jgi:hypothetical protein